MRRVTLCHVQSEATIRELEEENANLRAVEMELEQLRHHNSMLRDELDEATTPKRKGSPPATRANASGAGEGSGGGVGGADALQVRC